MPPEMGLTEAQAAAYVRGGIIIGIVLALVGVAFVASRRRKALPLLCGCTRWGWAPEDIAGEAQGHAVLMANPPPHHPRCPFRFHS